MCKNKTYTNVDLLGLWILPFPGTEVARFSNFRPHIYNLNFDPQLSCRIIHIIQKPETSIGNRKGHESDICMVGPG
jgi:hypothetical protein